MEQHTQTQELISGSMIIADVIEKWPSTGDVMMKHGLHCFGCEGNTSESIEQGCAKEGMHTEQIKELLHALNDEAKKAPAKVAASSEDIANFKINITDNAGKKILEIMKNSQKEGFGLKFGVKPGGCAGYSYTLDFVKEPEAGDRVLEESGVKVFIDPKSLEMVNESTIDYVEALQGSGFKIKNPSAKKSCGCGKSDGF